MANTYSSVQLRYIYFTTVMSSCWQSEQQLLSAARQSLVRSLNPSHWNARQTHKFIETIIRGREVDCTMCKLNCKIYESTLFCTRKLRKVQRSTLTRTDNWHLWSVWMWYLLSIFVHWHALRNFETNRKNKCLAVLRRIKQLMLMFCRK